jgi:Tfp pilus assembly protein PilN
MVMKRARLAVIPLGDRLVVASVKGGRVDAFVVDAAEPASALRAELDARKIRSRAAALGLGRGSVVVKPIELPEVGGEVGDMVRFELERHVPFATDDAPFDFVPLPPDAGPRAAAGRRVLVIAADRRMVDGVMRIAHDAGLRPVSITAAVHDLIGLVHLSRKRRVVWVHRAGNDTDLMFLDGPALRLSRQVPNADDAALAAEITKSFGVVRWRACDSLWMSGDTAGPAPAGNALEDVGVPVTAPPWTKSAQRLLGQLGHEPRGAFEMALAAAVARRGRPLDLIPPALRPRRVTRAQVATLATATAAVALAIGALLMPGYRDRQRLRAVNAEITRVEPEVRSVERVRDELERKKKLLAIIESLETNTIRPLPVLRDLTDLMPNDAWLTLLSIDGKGVELTGQAAAASALIPLLENSPRLERVEFASPVTRGRDKEQFRILAKWEGPPGAPVATPAASRPGTGPAATSAQPPAATARRPRVQANVPDGTETPTDFGPEGPRRPGATGRQRQR